MNRRKFFGLCAALPAVPIAAVLPAVAEPEVINVIQRASYMEVMPSSQINETARRAMVAIARYRAEDLCGRVNARA